MHTKMISWIFTHMHTNNHVQTFKIHKIIYDFHFHKIIYGKCIFKNFFAIKAIYAFNMNKQTNKK